MIAAARVLVVGGGIGGLHPLPPDSAWLERRRARRGKRADERLDVACRRSLHAELVVVQSYYGGDVPEAVLGGGLECPFWGG